MELLCVLLVPFSIIAVWIFFKYSPKACNFNVTIYNRYNLLIVVLCSVLYGYYIYKSMMKGTDVGWAPVVTYIFSFGLLIMMLLLSLILRNFIIFKIVRKIKRRDLK